MDGWSFVIGFAAGNAWFLIWWMLDNRLWMKLVKRLDKENDTLLKAITDRTDSSDWWKQ